MSNTITAPAKRRTKADREAEAATLAAIAKAETEARAALIADANPEVGYDTLTVEEKTVYVRAEWSKATVLETTAVSFAKAAKIAAADTRVLKCRVAFKAAMIEPNDGQPNLSGAARVLDPEKAEANIKSARSSWRNYVNAGIALNDAGLVNNPGAPDANERKIVADVFTAKAQERKARETEAKAKAETGETAPEGDAQDETGALGVADLMGHISRLEATFKLITASKVMVTEGEAQQVAEMLATFTAELSQYAEGI